MKLRKFPVTLILAMLFLALGVPAQATLLTIGTATYGGNNYNLVYDAGAPNGPITWLDYSNNSNTWADQMAWASGLNTAGVLTYNLLPGYIMNWGTWRLPSTVDGPFVFGYNGTTTGGYNITISEMGHLYYTELGNMGQADTSGNFQPGFGLSNTGPFVNLQNSYYYSGTEYATLPGRAWIFDSGNGYQTHLDENNYTPLALAVSAGHLETAPVPEPSTMLLLGVGLAGLAGLQYRRRGCGHT